MLIPVDDSQLPVLRTLDAGILAQITGESHTELLRFRYQPGRRAVLHVAHRNADSGDTQEGVIWFFAGNKAARLARLYPSSSYHKATGALHECFPWDHRLREISVFVAHADTVLEKMTGRRLKSQPELLRYRPGISATFRCSLDDQSDCYAKIIAKEDLNDIAGHNSQISSQLNGTDVAIARVLAIDTGRRLIIYESAAGVTLEDILVSATDTDTVNRVVVRVVKALKRLSSLSGIQPRILGREELLLRAENACRLIALKDSNAAKIADSLLMRMKASRVRHREQLIHGDMKLEHAFLTENCVTFIDTESLSIGDLNYDLAKLDARILSAFVQGLVTKPTMDAMAETLYEFVSTDYGWYRDAAILQTAKYFAQRPGQLNTEYCRTLLRMAT